MNAIPLGAWVRDKVTQFTGTVILCTLRMNAEPLYGVQSRTLVNGRPLPLEWFPECRLERLKPPEK